LIKGNYTGLYQIQIPSYTILEVVGKLQAKANLDKHFIYSNGTSDIEIFGGEIDGNGGSQSADMDTIYFGYVIDSIIHHTTVGGAYRSATDGENIELENCARVTVSNCYTYIYGTGYDHIKLTGTTKNCIIESNICNGTAYHQPSNAIQIASGSYNLIANNYVYTRDWGIKLHSANYNTIIGNYVQHSTGADYGIDIIDYSDHNYIIDNTILSFNIGLSYRNSSVTTGYDNIYKNNVIYLPSSSGKGIYLQGGANRTRLVGNTIIGNIGVADIAIEILSGAEDTFIERNDLLDSEIETQISNSGTNTVIQYNRGFLTENNGAEVTCYNGTWIPHGLAGDPGTTGSITLALRGATSYNATFILKVPTVLQSNSTHFQIEFNAWETAGWTQVPVTVVEAQTVYWDATYQP